MARVLIAVVLLLVANTTAQPQLDLGFDLLTSGVGGDEVIRQPLAVEGRIPSWLNGILIQNGGGRFEWPGKKLHRNLTNPGDGYAKLEAFSFKEGEVSYTSKFARSAWWNKSVAVDDIAPSLTFGVPQPPRLSDKLGIPNLMAKNDNMGVNVIKMSDEVLMISDQPGSISFNPQTLEFGQHQSSLPGPKKAYVDHPPIPKGMAASFGSAHPLWSGSSLDSSGDAYGLLNVQRLTKLDPRHEEIRLFKISAEEQRKAAQNETNAWLTRHTITTLNISNGEFAPYMHSFFLVGDDARTGPTHAVLVQHAMNIAMASMMAGVGLKPISAAFDIDLSRPMIFHVISLGDGSVAHTIRVNMSDFIGGNDNSMIVSHTVNAYFEPSVQEGQGATRLVMDVIGYDFLFFDRFSSTEFLNKTERDHGTFSNKRAKTFRFILELKEGGNSKAVEVFELLPRSDWEFPTINEGWKGKKYCFAYGYEFRHEQEWRQGAGATGMASMAMIKYNMCSGLNKVTGKRQGSVFTRPFNYFSEPWFVPRPGGRTEDDGVVLVMALDGAKKKGVLYVLNAKDLCVLATVRLPVLVNLKTHGRFFWSK